MAVGVQCRGRILVPHRPLDSHHIAAVSNQPRREEVPEIVEAEYAAVLAS